MTNVSVVTMHSRPQMLERVYVLERSVADVHLCASFRDSTSASVVELTRVLRWICTTLLLACDITIAASVMEPAASAVTPAVAVAASASGVDERGVIRALELPT